MDNFPLRISIKLQVLFYVYVHSCSDPSHEHEHVIEVILTLAKEKTTLSVNTLPVLTPVKVKLSHCAE